MHPIDTQPPHPDFAACWQAAGIHLQTQGEGESLNWLKAKLEPPFLEHLSFTMGNQLFFVRIEDPSGRVQVPGSRQGLLGIASECQGHACILEMGNDSGAWTPSTPGWGLVDCETGKTVVPPKFVTEEPIAMTDWELHDFAVQMVRTTLEKEGKQIMSAQGNPAVDPSLWFVGEEGPEWVVVRAVRYPTVDATPPNHWAAIADSVSKVSSKGHFASVAVANADDGFEEDAPPVPLWRGAGMHVAFPGLVSGPGGQS